MIKINMDEELALYNLTGKWNDYIGVQKRVIQILKMEGFFVCNDVVNYATGMHIRINSKGIKETLGTGKRFQALPKILKEYKVATLRYLKQMIREAQLIEDNVENIHTKEGYEFAYFYTEVMLGCQYVRVRISIQKRISANYFWIHNIDIKQKSSKLLDPSGKTELKEI